LEQLQQAAQLEPDNPTSHYNLGLLYLKKKDFDSARASAKGLQPRVPAARTPGTNSPQPANGASDYFKP
jgi:Flp pilus assembly protein TadD